MPTCDKLDPYTSTCRDHPGVRCVNVDLKDCVPTGIQSRKGQFEYIARPDGKGKMVKV